MIVWWPSRYEKTSPGFRIPKKAKLSDFHDENKEQEHTLAVKYWDKHIDDPIYCIDDPEEKLSVYGRLDNSYNKETNS